MVESIRWFKSFHDALEDLPAEEVKALVLGIGQYAFYDEEPELQGTPKAIYKLIRPVIDKSISKSEAGKKGGEATGKQTEAKAKQTEAKRKQIEADVKQTEANGSKREAEGEKDKGVGEGIGVGEDKKTIARSDSAESSEPEADVELIPLNTGEEWRPTISQYDEYCRLYPGVDITAQFRSMRAWCLSNPTKRKTRSGVTRFVNSWLSKEQNNGRASPKPEKFDATAYLKERAGL